MKEFDWSKALTERLRRGDPTALNEIHTAYYEKLRYMAYQLIRNMADAEDIAINTFIKLWNRRNQVGEMNGAYLFVSVRNACKDYNDHQAVVKRVGNELAYTSDKQENTVQQQDELEERADKLQMINKAIENLPAMARKVIKLFYGEELNNEEIASLLGIEVSTVKSHKVKGLQLIRKAVGRSPLLISTLYLTAQQYFFWFFLLLFTICPFLL